MRSNHICRNTSIVISQSAFRFYTADYGTHLTVKDGQAPRPLTAQVTGESVVQSLTQQMQTQGQTKTRLLAQVHG